MDRAEWRRRKKEEAKKEKKYTLTQRQIDIMREEMFQEAVDASYPLMLSIAGKTLKKHWKKTASKRIPEFIDDCIDLYNDIEMGKITIHEIIKEVEETCGRELDYLPKMKEQRRKRFGQNK